MCCREKHGNNIKWAAALSVIRELLANPPSTICDSVLRDFVKAGVLKPGQNAQPLIRHADQLQITPSLMQNVV